MSSSILHNLATYTILLICVASCNKTVTTSNDSSCSLYDYGKQATGKVYYPQYSLVIPQDLLTNIIEGRNLDNNPSKILSDTYFVTLNLNTLYTTSNERDFQASDISLSDIYFRSLKTKCNEPSVLCKNIRIALALQDLYKYSSLYGNFYQTVFKYGTLDPQIPHNKCITIDIHRPWFDKGLLTNNHTVDQYWYIKSIITSHVDHDIRIHGYILNNINQINQ